MLATIAVCLVFAKPAMLDQQPSGGDIVSKMLKYYADAQSMKGTITLTVSDGGGQAQMGTELQFERPSKLYIRQYKGGRAPQQWLAVSDGSLFSYDSPDMLGSNPGQIGSPGSQTRRLTEHVLQATGEFMTDAQGKRVAKMANYDVRQIYAVVAAGSLGDRSVPLDVAIGRHEDLQHDVLTWMTVDLQGKVKIDGVEANQIVGKWRPYGEAATDATQAPGQYEMIVTDEGKLLRYTILQYLPRDPRNPSDYVKLLEIWNVDLTVNAKADASLFKVQ
jgi:hypothetical protein